MGGKGGGRVDIPKVAPARAPSDGEEPPLEGGQPAREVGGLGELGVGAVQGFRWGPVALVCKHDTESSGSQRAVAFAKGTGLQPTSSHALHWGFGPSPLYDRPLLFLLLLLPCYQVILTW